MKIVYHIRFRKHFKKRIQLSPALLRKYEERIRIFAVNSKEIRLKDHPLYGDLEGYRSFSITGDIRVIYFIKNSTYYFIDVGTHNQVY